MKTDENNQDTRNNNQTLATRVWLLFLGYLVILLHSNTTKCPVLGTSVAFIATQ